MSGTSFASAILAGAEDQTSGARSLFAPHRIVLSGTRAPGVFLRIGDDEVPHDPERLVLSLDFHAPEVESSVPRARARCRTRAESLGMRHVLDLNAGIGSVAAVEWGLALPGRLVLGCGRCLGVVGGIGALGLRLEEPSLVEAMIAGRTAIPGIRPLRVEVQGKLPRHLGAWDVARATAALLGDALAGTVVEFAGEVRGWSVELRMGVCGFLSEMGAMAALVIPDETVDEYLEARGASAPEPPVPPGGTEKVATHVLQVDEVASVAAESYTGAVIPWSGGDAEAAVHGAFVGSCYSGYLRDFALVAEVLKKAGRVHPGVRLTVSPATLEVARACLHAGFTETFLGAGAMVTVPGAGAGNIAGGAILGEGEHLAATSEYSRPQVPGQHPPRVTVMSPAAAAAAAVTGRRVDPAEFLV